MGRTGFIGAAGSSGRTQGCKALVLVCGLWVVPLVAGAEVSEAELAQCAGIEDDRQRLECFDRLAARYQKEGSVGAWKIDRRVSLLGDESSVALRLSADRPIPLRRGTYTPTLNIECGKGAVSPIFIDVGVELDLKRVGRDGAKYYEATLRYDRETPRSAELRGVDNGQRLYFPAPEDELNSMVQHAQLLLEVTPFSRPPVATQFSLRGLASGLDEVAEACGR